MARFKVERTSDMCWDNQKPCSEAVEGTVQVWDVRTFKSPEEHDARFPRDRWASRGREHTIGYGPRGGVQGIRRRMEDRRAWFVELEDLDALLAFWRKYGELVLKVAVEDGSTPTIEIYDNYRE